MQYGGTTTILVIQLPVHDVRECPFDHDANGNLASGGANAYAYDVEIRLVAIAGAHNATLAYDPLGRLASLTAGAATTTFLYDGDALAVEYNDRGTVQRRYAHWVGQPAPAEAGVPMIWYEGATLGDPHHLIADERGSIVAVTGPSASSVAIKRRDAKGEVGAAVSRRGRRARSARAVPAPRRSSSRSAELRAGPG